MTELISFNPIDFLHKFEIENLENYVKTISFGNELEFKYIDFQNYNIDFQSNNIDKINIEIFKFNMALIIGQLNIYFNNVTIKITFDEPNRNEFLIKDYDKTIKHDVYVSLYKSNEYFDCGFDYIEKSLNIDNYRNISSLINLDYYKYFDEECDNYNIFIEEIIFRLLIILCSLNSDEYKLAEILFIKTNNHLDNLQEQVDKFKKIIYGKKEGNIDLMNFYEVLLPVDIETGDDMNYKEFIKYIESKIKFKLDFLDNNKIINWSIFELILMNLDSDISIRIDNYKMVYIQATNTLFEALKTINDLIKQINKTKKYNPQYIEEFLINDLINYKNKESLQLIYENLSEYFRQI
jgi:hypothetical protein